MEKKFATKKRMLSLFLALLLVVNLLPVSLLTALADTATDTDADVEELIGSGWWTDTQSSTAQTLVDGTCVTFSVSVWSDTLEEGEYAAFCVEATDGSNYFTGTSDCDCWGAGTDTDGTSTGAVVGGSYTVAITRSGNNFTADITDDATGESILEKPMYLEGTKKFGSTECYIFSQVGNLYVSVKSIETVEIDDDSSESEPIEATQTDASEELVGTEWWTDCQTSTPQTLEDGYTVSFLVSVWSDILEDGEYAAFCVEAMGGSGYFTATSDGDCWGSGTDTDSFVDGVDVGNSYVVSIWRDGNNFTADIKDVSTGKSIFKNPLYLEGTSNFGDTACYIMSQVGNLTVSVISIEYTGNSDSEDDGSGSVTVPEADDAEELIGSGWWTDIENSTPQTLADGGTVTFYVYVWSDTQEEGEYAAFCVEATDGTNYFTATSDGDCWGAGTDTDGTSAGAVVGGTYVVTISRSGYNFTADIVDAATEKSILENPMYLAGTSKYGKTTCYIMSQVANLTVWTAGTRTVTFDPNYADAEEIAAQTVTYGLTAEEPAAISRPGYSYIWCIVGTTTEYDFDTPVTADLELYAKWDRATYTVTFDADGGTLNDAETVNVKYNAAAAEPADPTKTGYIFLGWYTEDGEAYDFDTLVTSDRTLTAKWQEKIYNVTFDLNGGELVVDGETVTWLENTVSYGATAARPEPPTRTGYTFEGWYTVGTLDVYDFDTPVTGGTDLYAKWTRTVCTVTFDTVGGTDAPEAQTVKYGATAAEPLTEPEREYYSFSGWYTADGEVFDFDSTLITENLTIYAGWTALYDAAEIITQPEDIAAYDGDRVCFTVTATGTKLSYQWQFSTDGGTTWANSAWKENKCEVSATQKKNGYLYRCVVTDVYGNERVSPAVCLTVEGIEITSQPEDVIACVGDTAVFNVTATGKDIVYQWQYSVDGGATWTNSAWQKDRCEVTVEERRNGYLYRCVVTDANGNTAISDIAGLTVSAIAVSLQPEDITATVGETATFTVAASGNDISYQWQYSMDGGVTWKNSAWKTEKCEVSVSAKKNGYLYRCVLTDADGNTRISDAAELIVVVE